MTVETRPEVGMKREEWFDFVIVGSGPAAIGLLYGLLETCCNTEQREFSIAIVERGSGPPTSTLCRLPHQWFEASHTDNQNLDLLKSNMAGRQISVPVGVGVGGTSNINACICALPPHTDFETWPHPWNNNLWQSAHQIRTVLDEHQAIRCYRDNHLPEECSGPINWSDVDLLVEEEPKGSFKRLNLHEALLQPFLDRHPHLRQRIHWLLKTEAQRLVFDDSNRKRVIGIECFNKEKEEFWTVKARREVLLCAGAIESPALLLVSGLSSAIPGLGRHLQDQLLVARVTMFLRWKARRLSPNGISALGNMQVKDNSFQVAIADANCYTSVLPSMLIMPLRRWQMKRPLAWALDIGSWFAKTATKVLLAYTPIGTLVNRCLSITMVFLMNPKSEGFISVRRDPTKATAKVERRRDVKVEVDVGYLQDLRDVDSLREGLEALSSGGGLELIPGPCRGLSRLPWFCRVFSAPYFHYSSSCSMKSRHRQDWVVCTDLKVRGLTGVRVCDASVFPSLLSCPPSLTCAALGYELGKSLKSKMSKE